MSKPRHWNNNFHAQNIRKRGERGRSIAPELAMFRPEELLDPAELLKRFSETAQQLLDGLPTADRPRQAEVVGALRQAVLEAFRTREEYLARLVESDLEARGSGNRMSSLKWQVSVRKALLGLGVRVVEETEEREHFVVVEGEGEGFEVLRPAYVDQATGKLVLAGQLRRVHLPGRHQSSTDTTQDTSATEEKP
ncbi:hypothetical protein [Streptomyces sp. NPDC002078]